MSERRPSVVYFVLLTWANLAVLVVNFWLSSRHERSVQRASARTSEMSIPFLVERRRESEGIGRIPARRTAGEDPRESEGVVTLSDSDFDRLVEAVIVEDRVRMRVSALRQGMERLEQRGVLSPLNDDVRSRIVTLGRRVAMDRARLERRLLAEDSLSLATWDREIETYDDRVREETRRELQGMVSATEVDHLLRFIVPLRQSLGTMR